MNGGTLTVQNSLVANNACGMAPTNDDYFRASGTLTDNGTNGVAYSNTPANAAGGFNHADTIVYNTKYNTASTTETTWTRRGVVLDRQNLNLSDTLADNGGPTETLAILAETGIPVGNGLYDAAVPTDQRGVNRHDPGSTIGAYEHPYDPPAEKVALTGPATVTAGSVSTVFTLTSQDADNNAANVDEDTVFDLTSNSTGTARFYRDAAGSTEISETTITEGNSTCTFYYKDTAAGTATVTASRKSGMSLGSATHDITVVGGVVTGTVFEDLNGNGIQDDGETGIPDVTVQLNSVRADRSTPGR